MSELQGTAAVLFDLSLLGLSFDFLSMCSLFGATYLPHPPSPAEIRTYRGVEIIHTQTVAFHLMVISTFKDNRKTINVINFFLLLSYNSDLAGSEYVIIFDCVNIAK